MFEDLFPAMETLNGHIPAGNNRSAARLAQDWQKAAVGGSDAHTIETLALTYTEVAGATARVRPTSKLCGTARGQVAGASGNYAKLTRAVLGIASKPGVANVHGPCVLTPLMLAVPLVTLANYFCELSFQAHWSRSLWPAALREPNCSGSRGKLVLLALACSSGC